LREKAKWVPRVIYGARWDYDKGNDRFVEFAKVAQRAGVRCFATGPTELNGKYQNITFLGWLSQDQLRRFCAEGGYLFGDARQEVFPYSVVHALFFGLTPILANTPIYDVFGFDPRYRFDSYQEALGFILSGETFSADDWLQFEKQHAPNALQLAEEIAGVKLHIQPNPSIKGV